MTKIYAEDLFGVSNIALIRIERAPTNVQRLVNSYKNVYVLYNLWTKN